MDSSLGYRAGIYIVDSEKVCTSKEAGVFFFLIQKAKYWVLPEIL